MLDWIVQAAIMITGGGAIALLACRNPRLSKGGWVFGVIGAPVWIYLTWPFSGDASNWGIFALSVWYVVHWSRGLWAFFIRDRRST